MMWCGVDVVNLICDVVDGGVVCGPYHLEGAQSPDLGWLSSRISISLRALSRPERFWEDCK